jgi:hypothetical protein
MTYIPPKKINYLSNKEILKEINESKKTFCYFIDKKYEDYDVIVETTDDITSEIIEKALATRKRRLENKNEPVSALDIVIRRITNEHIPVCPIREAKAETKINKDTKVKTNFAAFKHYFIDSMDITNTDIEQEDENGVITITTVPKYTNIILKEGGRSHWENGLENGSFVGEKGRISNRLALMFMKLVDKYGQRSNWRNYSYLDEMKAQALLQLSTVGLQFDEHRSENPFAYYTTIITTSFTRILNTEKKNQNLRDDLLEQAGEVSSSTRQLDHESTEAQARELAFTLTDEDDLITASEQHYDLHTRKISAKKEDFVKAVLAHYNHNNK